MHQPYRFSVPAAVYPFPNRAQFHAQQEEMLSPALEDDGFEFLPVFCREFNRLLAGLGHRLKLILKFGVFPQQILEQTECPRVSGIRLSGGNERLRRFSILASSGKCDAEILVSVWPRGSSFDRLAAIVPALLKLPQGVQ